MGRGRHVEDGTADANAEEHSEVREAEAGGCGTSRDADTRCRNSGTRSAGGDAGLAGSASRREKLADAREGADVGTKEPFEFTAVRNAPETSVTELISSTFRSVRSIRIAHVAHLPSVEDGRGGFDLTAGFS